MGGGIGAHHEEDYSVLKKFVEAPWDFLCQDLVLTGPLASPKREGSIADGEKISEIMITKVPTMSRVRISSEEPLKQAQRRGTRCTMEAGMMVSSLDEELFSRAGYRTQTCP